MNKQLIYIVEDDEGIREVYEGAAGDEYDVETFDSGAGFFARLREKKPDLIILDIMLPDVDGRFPSSSSAPKATKSVLSKVSTKAPTGT